MKFRFKNKLKRIADILEKLGVAGIVIGVFQGIFQGSASDTGRGVVLTILAIILLFMSMILTKED